jgi:hypothetical protein
MGFTSISGLQSQNASFLEMFHKIALLFAALHKSANGTKRTSRDVRYFRFRGKADLV